MKKLYSNFDALYVAFKGCIPVIVREQLAEAKAEAGLSGLAQSVTIRGIKGAVKSTGAAGGYAYILDEGPLGLKYLFKDNGEPENWNIFVQASAQMLALDGYKSVRDAMLSTLRQLGVKIVEHAINRVDYAVDFECDNFELDPRLFVAHHGTTIKRHYENDEGMHQNISVIGGAHVTSVTIGQMPGRQIIVYNKKKEATKKQKLFWFDYWGRKKEDCGDVWRIEVRAGKRHLKEWAVQTFDDLEGRIGTVFLDALQNIRYVESRKGSNVTRAKLHNIWLNVIDIFTQNLWDYIGNVTRGVVIETLRVTREKMLGNQLIGLSASHAAVEVTDLQGDALKRHVLSRIYKNLSNYLDREWGSFVDKMEKASDRVFYLDELEAA